MVQFISVCAQKISLSLLGATCNVRYGNSTNVVAEVQGRDFKALMRASARKLMDDAWRPASFAFQPVCLLLFEWVQQVVPFQISVKAY